MAEVIPEAALDQWEASAHTDSIIGRLRDERKTMNQVIPEAAVEAAASALALKTYDKEFNAMGDYTQNLMLDSARLALEAAASHMLACAWEEGRQAEEDAAPLHRAELNPYRPTP